MVLKLRKLTTSFIAALLLVTGFMAAPAGVLPGTLGTQKAAASCGTNVYQVVWSYAGIYHDNPDRYNVVHVATLQGGNRIHGLNGYHRIQYRSGYGWITLVWYNGPFGYTFDYWMRSDALQYIGCY
jgi:hypothetical protein